MKLLICLIYMILAANSWSGTREHECEQRLLGTGSQVSKAYTFNTDLIRSRDYGSDHLARSIFYTRHLLKVQGCRRKAVNFAQGPSGRSKSYCKRVHRNAPTSLACYIESNLGYFFVNYDFHTGVHIIFNRWD